MSIYNRLCYEDRSFSQSRPTAENAGQTLAKGSNHLPHAAQSKAKDAWRGANTSNSIVLVIALGQG
jgi:hypothetical protein